MNEVIGHVSGFYLFNDSLVNGTIVFSMPAGVYKYKFVYTL